MSDYSTFLWALDKAKNIEQQEGPGAAQAWLSQFPLRDNVKEVVMDTLLGRDPDPNALSQQDTIEHGQPKQEQAPFFQNPQPHPLGDVMQGYGEGAVSPEDYLNTVDQWNQGLIDMSEGRDLRDLKETVKQPVLSQHVLRWQPGQRGRGILVGNPDDGQRYLHTWPVNVTPDNPQGGLMHGEYLRQYEHDPNNTKGGFEIDPDGKIVLAKPEDIPEAIAADPNLKNPADEFGFLAHESRYLPRNGSRLF